MNYIKRGIRNSLNQIALIIMLIHANRYIYIVMEYCDGGDLLSFIKKKYKLSESICRRFLQQLALALRYLRDHNVCHMDLKPQNLLLMKKPQLVLKVGGW